jgi:hypothetical protein
MIGIGATLFKVPTAYGQGFSPASLFSSGEAGAWYDPSDLTKVFQVDGTTPTVPWTSGDILDANRVGKLVDKSGNGNDLVQTTLTKCPALKLVDGLYFLEFDGTDDGLRSADIDFTGTTTMSVFSGARKEADEIAVVAELSNTFGSNAGTFRLASINGNIWRYSSKGTVGVNASATGYTPPVTSVLTGLSDIANDVTTIRVDGVQKASLTSDQGTGSFGDYPLNLGARNNGTLLPLEGRVYGFIVRGVLSNASEIASTEAYIAGKTGVSI